MYKMPKTSKATAKMVKKIVREELSEELEEKVGVIGFANEPIDTSAIPSGNVGSSSNFAPLFPLIEHGGGKYNKRIGNEIRLKHIDLEMLLSYISSVSDTGGYTDTSVGVRVMILRQKDDNDYQAFKDDAQTDKLLQTSGVTAGPSNFSGSTINLLQQINRDQFSVRYDKVHYLDRARRFNDDGTQLQFNRPPRPTFIKKRLTFGKRGLKLTFGNDASTSPTNFPYLLVVGVASTIDSTAPSNNLIEYSYSARAVYTDA
jgi:hypothetical protein